MFEEGKHNSCLQGFYEQGSCVKSTAVKDFELIAITDTASCPRSLVKQVERLAGCTHKPNKLILRAKDLSTEEYGNLAQQVLPLCQRNDIELILHSHWQIALELGITQVHMPLPLLPQMPEEAQAFFNHGTELAKACHKHQSDEISPNAKGKQKRANHPLLSTSVHSVAEAEQALKLGANALIAGHIYATNCKAGLPPRGLEFLQSICACVRQKQAEAMGKATWLAEAQVPSQAIPQAIPVYAIGGIGFDEKQWQELRDSGACGACIMSAYMKI